MLCRQTYGFQDCPGYLRSGLPLEYGEGGVDFIRERTFSVSEDSEDLGAGDVERLMIEWKSLLDMIIHGPDLGIPRWSELQTIAQKLNGSKGQKDQLPELPELPARQRKRYESQIRR